MSGSATGGADLIFRRLDTAEAIISILQYQLKRQSHKQEKIYNENSELKYRLSECTNSLNDALKANQELTQPTIEVESQRGNLVAKQAELISRVQALEVEKRQLTLEIKQWKKRCFDAVYKDVKNRPVAITVTPEGGTDVRYNRSQHRGTRDDDTISLRNQASKETTLKTREIPPIEMSRRGANLSGWDATVAHKMPYGDYSGVRPILHRPPVPFHGAIESAGIANGYEQHVNDHALDRFGGSVSINRDISTITGQQHGHLSSAASTIQPVSNIREFWVTMSPIHRQMQIAPQGGHFMEQRYRQDCTLAARNPFIEPAKENPSKRVKGTIKPALDLSNPTKHSLPDPSSRKMAFYFCPQCLWCKAFYLDLQPPLETNGNVSDKIPWNASTFRSHIASVRKHMKRNHPEVEPVVWPPGFAYR